MRTYQIYGHVDLGMWASKTNTHNILKNTKHWHLKFCTSKDHSYFLKRTRKSSYTAGKSTSSQNRKLIARFHKTEEIMWMFLFWCALWQALDLPRIETQMFPHLHSQRAFRLHFFHLDWDRDSLNCFASNLWEKALHTCKALANCIPNSAQWKGKGLSELRPLASNLEEIKFAYLIWAIDWGINWPNVDTIGQEVRMSGGGKSRKDFL